MLDTSGSALGSGISPGVYLVKPNLRELAELAGAPIADDEQMTAAARSIIERGLSEVVVVSLGAGGGFPAYGECMRADLRAHRSGPEPSWSR